MTEDNLQIELQIILTKIKSGLDYDKDRFKLVTTELRKLGYPV